jgi:hypothetical protein
MEQILTISLCYIRHNLVSNFLSKEFLRVKRFLYKPQNAAIEKSYGKCDLMRPNAKKPLITSAEVFSIQNVCDVTDETLFFARV